ncbi:MAG: hypothetical protein HOI62_04840 [Gemmatimonadales bacterium]|jgi:N-acetylglucosamine kinase-like BadF-type ATPase|nr:hypothetical protein [Gemmatimonadales bacterium]MBT5695906.1 hypothetical protein [Gemmatimonadales bacterium]
MRIVVGVDGGGTSTRAVVLDETGHEMARAEGPGAVATLDDPGAVSAAVVSVVARALEDADVTLPVDVLWAGLSGAGRDDVQAAVRASLMEASLAERVFVGTDVEAAFSDAFPLAEPGILLIAGTGSILWARSPGAHMIRVGGWGQDMGDEGSGYWIGREALRSVAAAADGRGPETELTGKALVHSSGQEPGDLIAWAASASKSDIAALAPAVTEVADAGDGVAERILSEAVEELVGHITVGVERSGPWQSRPTLCVWGGLVWKGGPLHRRLNGAVRQLAVDLASRELDPPAGAARMALSELGDQP